MRLATIRTGSSTQAVRIDGEAAVELGFPSVGELLRTPDWEGRAAGPQGASHDAASLSFAPLVPQPGKIFCVGLNYRSHILEMGRELPEYPTLFAKFTESLIGPDDDIVLDGASDAVDWEAELALVIGTPVRRADESTAAAAIAGFSVLNDVTMRDWQTRTLQWLQGKTFEHSTPFGPYLVTPDELPGGTRPALDLTCTVDGEQVQQSSTDDLVFDPVALVSYISRIITLNPGDVIATGTPGGVGHARDPKRYLADGEKLVTEIEHLGRLENTVRVVHPAA